jgi:hypothetical protein
LEFSDIRKGDVKMRIRWLVQTSVWLAVLGTCIPQIACAAAPTTPAVVDIALSDGGVLHGRVVDLKGSGVVNTGVSVKAQDREIARATTTADGRFSVQGLHAGVYRLAANDSQGVYRFWATNTAPPSAQRSAIVYTADQGNAADGGSGRGTLKMFLAHPIVLAAIVATAIAVPVALATSHSGSS